MRRTTIMLFLISHILLLRWKPPPTKSEEEDKYRDRAKERRLGANPDYKDVEAELSAPGFQAVGPPQKCVQDD